MAIKIENAVEELFDLTQQTTKLAQRFDSFDQVHVEIATAMACLIRARGILRERQAQDERLVADPVEA